VNALWARAVPLLQQIGVRELSRAGPVLVAPHPVMSVYERPTERVLMDPARNANPFFHFFECLWMMSGSHDAGFLNTFVGDFGKRFAGSDGVIHGAYGFRWYNHFCIDKGDEEIDQIEAVVEMLTDDPTTRHAVIAMWDPMADLKYRGRNYAWKDRPCNTHIYLRVRPEIETEEQYLDLTVMCRSNDIVWGAYGANAVHFSFLQEYIAGRLGVRVGRMYQLSNNWHAYEAVLQSYLEKAQDAPPYKDLYQSGVMQPMPIGDKWGSWRTDLFHFMDELGDASDFNNAWFSSVAKPMWRAHSLYKQGLHGKALVAMEDVAASDWARAGRQWLMALRKAA
jgi:hypothetical protein